MIKPGYITAEMSKHFEEAIRLGVEGGKYLLCLENIWLFMREFGGGGKGKRRGLYGGSVSLPLTFRCKCWFKKGIVVVIYYIGVIPENFRKKCKFIFEFVITAAEDM